MRPVLEYNTVIWSPHTVHDIEAVESVQRRFTKCLNGFRQFPYEERLRRLDLQSLELRRLHVDLIMLIWCYKVVFGLVDTDMNDFFKFNTRTTSRGHRYKLYKERAITGTRSHFLVNVL